MRSFLRYPVSKIHRLLCGILLMLSCASAFTPVFAEVQTSSPQKLENSPPTPENTPPSDDVVRLLSIIDYIRGDYAEAIASDGKIRDHDEYVEMQQFASTAKVIFASLANALATTPKERDTISAFLDTLAQHIESRHAHKDILAITDLLKAQLISSFAIKTSPRRAPQLQLARAAFAANCVSCHGERADGQGPLAKSFDPQPRSFQDAELAALASPFKYFNSTFLGISGTAMPSFRHQLREDELWSLGFFLAEIPYHHEKAFSVSLEERQQLWAALPQQLRGDLVANGLSLSMLASFSNQDLANWSEQLPASLWEQLTVAGVDRSALLHLLRVAAPYYHDLPVQAHTDNAAAAAAAPSLARDGASQFSASQHTLSGIRLAHSKVNEALAQFAAGNAERAEKTLLDAYLLGFEKAEVSLRLVDAHLVKNVEGLFIEMRAHAQRREASLFSTTGQRVLALLSEAEDLYQAHYGSRKSMSGWSSFAASLLIILREGFEAFLLIAALLALLTSMGSVRGKRWVHAGWISALLAGFISFAVFERILHLSGAAKETIEACSTGVAVVFLFYTGFWLLSQSERMHWGRFLKTKTSVALSSGSLWGLFSMSFIAVYREAAETILFYVALYNTTSSPFLVSLGFLVGCLALIAACWGILRYNLRLPIKQFFLVTSCFMLTLAVILAGKTVHELIEAGYIQASPLSWMPAIEFLGLYPSAETLAAQLLLIVFGLGLGWFIRRRRAS